MREIENIKLGLGRLSVAKALAFAASCCERLLPNYLAFSVIENWGDFDQLRILLDNVWVSLYGQNEQAELSTRSLDELIQLAPDTEDFTSMYTSLAGDAVAALVYTVEAKHNTNECLEKIILVSDISRDSIFEYLSVVNDPTVVPHVEEEDFEERIFQYPLMVAELRKQQQDISLLSDAAVLDSSFFAQLKSSSEVCGIQPFKRRLVKISK